MKKFLVLSLLIFLGITSCGSSNSGVVVASKIDTEGALLGKMIVHVLRNAGIKVTDKTEFGTTDIIRKAIISGEIDLYPEYTGNGAFLFHQTSDIWKDFQKSYETVKKLDYDANKIVWLTPAPANNTWAIAVRKDLSEKENIKTMEDFSAYINKGGKVKLVCSDEFVTRPDSLPAFQKAYGFTLKKNQLLTLSGGNTAQTEKAAAQGINGVNFAMAYGTDGALAPLNLVVLADTKKVQPVYAPTAIVREDALKKYPQISKLLKPVFESLTGEVLQQLNGRIAVGGEDASVVALDYLKKQGFIKK